MKVLDTIAAARAASSALPRPLGLAPTMGSLHEGHLALVRTARTENASVAVSVFVNPTQFGDPGDFDRYPRDLDRDLDLLKKAKVDLVFAPAANEMYPPEASTSVIVERLTERLEGEFRPGHFRGVATVVAKLFHILVPDRAYFGQKDAQQLCVIRKMVADLDMAVDIRPVATVREADGLAMSSRNVLLSANQRAAATVLCRALGQAEQRYRAGDRSGQSLRDAMRSMIAAEPLARPDYISVAAADSLEELDEVDRPALLSLAVRFGDVRLIDNVSLP